jgi:glycosyltransferase involved in cell wall biosynthesis
MHLLHLSMDYPPRMAGGTTVHTYQLAKAEHAEGHEVTVIAAAAKGAPKEEVSEGIRIIRVSRPYTIWSGRAAKKVLKDVDIVHGHGTCARGHLSLNKGFPTVVKMHNTWLGEMERHRRMDESVSISRAAAMRLYTGMDRYCVERAHHIIAISEVIRRETLEYGVPDEKVTVIHNGIDTERFKVPEGTRERVRAELGLDGVVIGYIGRVAHHKNVGDLAKAVVALHDKDVSLLVVGDGDDIWRVRSLASPLKDRAKFVGFVDYNEVPKYYAAADIIVYPTLYEPLGNVPMEAMASGRPILASNVDGIPEVFVRGAGYLIEPNEEDIRVRLEELVSDPLLRKDMGAVGRRSMGMNSWRNVARRTVEVCGKVLGEL